MTIIQDLKKEDKLSQAGGDHYIIDLTMGVSSSAHIEYHVRVILEKYILRSLINVSANVIDSSYKESTDVLNFWTRQSSLSSRLPTERLRKDSILPTHW